MTVEQVEQAFQNIPPARVIESMTPEEIKARIDKARLEIEYLTLENERLRLQNENLQLRSLSQESNITSPVDSEEENVILESITEEILTEDINEIDTTALDSLDIAGSSILSFVLKTQAEEFTLDQKQLTYMGILRKVWTLTPRQMIYDNSLFDTRDYYYSRRGFKWIPEIQLSAQVGSNTMEILKEIVNICTLMKFTFTMKIIMENRDNVDISMTNELVVDRTTNTVKKADKLLYGNYWSRFSAGYGD